MKTKLMITGTVLSLIAIAFIAKLAYIQVISDEVYFNGKTQKLTKKEAEYGHILDRNGAVLWHKLSGETVYFHKHLEGLTAILRGIASSKIKILHGNDAIIRETVKPKRDDPINEVELMPLINGRDVYLSIDLRIQEIVENAVREYVPKFKAAGASVLVMDPRTGQILAITSFNPDSKKYEGTLYSYEPGSIFKPITAIIALENGVDPKKIIDTEDRKWQGTKSVNFEKIIKDNTKCEPCDMQAAMKYSSNITFGKYVVEEIGYEKFFYGVKNFAINDHSSDFPLRVIHKGFNRVPDLRTQATQGFGQSLDITSIDMAKAFSSIANGGILYDPKLILRYGKDSAATESDSVRKVISSTENTKILREMLRGVVESGTAEHLKSKYQFFEFAGKTGTAQMIDGSGKYAAGTYNSSFIGVERATDPHFVCLVTMYNTHSGGGMAAGPLFQKIMEQIYLHPELSPPAFSREYVSADSVCRNISFIGHTKTAASNMANGMRCNIRFDDENKTGFVAAQTIKIDSTGEYLELSLREHQRNTSLMPNVMGLTLKDAFGMLEHLKVIYDGVGKVYKQFPGPGEYIEKRDVVRIKLREDI